MAAFNAYCYKCGTCCEGVVLDESSLPTVSNIPPPNEKLNSDFTKANASGTRKKATTSSVTSIRDIHLQKTKPVVEDNNDNADNKDNSALFDTNRPLKTVEMPRSSATVSKASEYLRKPAQKFQSQHQQQTSATDLPQTQEYPYPITTVISTGQQQTMQQPQYAGQPPIPHSPYMQSPYTAQQYYNAYYSQHLQKPQAPQNTVQALLAVLNIIFGLTNLIGLVLGSFAMSFARASVRGEQFNKPKLKKAMLFNILAIIVNVAALVILVLILLYFFTPVFDSPWTYF